MARAFLVALFFLTASFPLSANLFDFGLKKNKEEDPTESKIFPLIEKIKKLNPHQPLEFEETFTELIRMIENAIDAEKLYCSGEATNQEGKTLPLPKRQFCMRELKNQYLEATKVIFETKRKYLSHLHQKQLEELKEIHSNIQKEIEKSF